MIPALWISKTGLDAQQTNISVASNNLANASTVGFKKGRAIFEDLLYQNVHQPGGRSSADTTLPSGLMLGAGTKVVATQKSFTQGDVQTTDNALDVMIDGRGFFEVQMPDGTTSYTRNGQFALNSEGTIVTSGAGYPILPEIQVPEGAKSISVSGDGQVSVTLTGDAEPQVVGQLTVTDFVNPAGLDPKGQNLFAETAASGQPQTAAPGTDNVGLLSQGYIESSNVNVVQELITMIQSQRTYELNSKAIQTSDQMLQRLGQL